MKDEDWEYITQELKNLGWKIEAKEVQKAYIINKDDFDESEEKEFLNLVRQRDFHAVARFMENNFRWPKGIRERMKLS